MPQLAFLPDSQRSSGHRPLLRLLLPVWVPFSRIFIRSQNIHNTLTTCKHKWAACWCMSIPEIFPAPVHHSLLWCHFCIIPWPFLFIPFSPTTLSPEKKPEEVIQPLLHPTSGLFSAGVFCYWMLLRVPHFHQSWCLCFYYFLIWLVCACQIWLSRSSTPQAQAACKTPVCCHECWSIILIRWGCVPCISGWLVNRKGEVFFFFCFNSSILTVE